MTSKIAVVVPTYNRKDLLPETIDSILNQACPEGWEFHLVVVDDESQDGTFDFLCERYSATRHSPQEASLTPNLTVLRKKNGERGAARNAGARWAIEHFHPDWILFFDSDDILGSNAFLSLKTRLERETPKNLVGIYGAMPIWEPGTPLPSPNRHSLYSREGNLGTIITKRSMFSICVMFISSKHYQLSQGFSENRQMSGSEDWNLLIRLLNMGNVAFAPGFLAYYRQHQGNTDCARFMVSIDVAIDELEPFFENQFPATCRDQIASLRRQAVFLKVGLLNSRGYTKEATQLLRKFCQNKFEAWLDLQTYRMGLSIAKRRYLA